MLLADLNDQPEHARSWRHCLRGRTALVNVIPYNPVAGLPLSHASKAARSASSRFSRQAGINVQIRERKGDEIDAACGQLRLAAARPVQIAL